MANVARTGATPVQHLDGSPWNGKATVYNVDSSNGTAIFPGDFVILEADGNIAPAAAGNTLLGVAVGVLPVESNVDFGSSATYHGNINLQRRYLPASTAGKVLVVDAPDVIFEVPEDGVGSDLALTDVGGNVDIVAGAGSTTTGQSGHLLDSSTIASTTAQVRILGKVTRPDNALGDNCVWQVLINEHIMKATAGI